MKNFILKARAIDNSSVVFKLDDIPTLYDDTHLVLLKQPGSPILDISSTLRGDPESGLFEGDIIKDETSDETFVICYERGFYAISSNYKVRYLYTFKNPEVVGDYYKDGFPVRINKGSRILFKCGKHLFRILDIIGNWGDKLIIRSCKEPIDPMECYQELCISYERKKLFLNDIVKDEHVELIGGRVCIPTSKGYFDLATKDILEDYVNNDSNN